MNRVKKIIIEEAAKVLREMKKRRKIGSVKSNLYEAVKTADMVKHNPRKYRIANKLVSISENRFIKERQRLKEEHGPEDESEMAIAQIHAIIEKSNELLGMIEGVTQLEDWLQYKLSIAENYIDAVHGYMKYFNGGNEMENDDIDDEESFDDVEEEDYDDEFEDMDDFDDEFEDIDDFDGELDYEDEEFDDEEDEDYYFSSDR